MHLTQVWSCFLQHQGKSQCCCVFPFLCFSVSLFLSVKVGWEQWSPLTIKSSHLNPITIHFSLSRSNDCYLLFLHSHTGILWIYVEINKWQVYNFFLFLPHCNTLYACCALCSFYLTHYVLDSSWNKLGVPKSQALCFVCF